MLLGLFCIGAQNRLIPGKCSSEYKGWYKGNIFGNLGRCKGGNERVKDDATYHFTKIIFTSQIFPMSRESS